MRREYMASASDLLPDDVGALKRIIAAKDDLLCERNSEIAAKRMEIGDRQTEINHLKEQNDLLRRALYGSRSEKLSAEEARQGLLFNEAEAYAAGGPDETRPKTTVKKHSRGGKRGRRALPAHLPREEFVHDVPEPERAGRRYIGDDTYEVLVTVPPKVYVEKHIYPKYALPEGVEFEGQPAIKTASRPKRIIEKSIASAGLLAYVFASKFCDHLPFHRLSKIFTRWGVDLQKATMCNWAIYVARRCERLIDLMWEEVRAGDVVAGDETGLQVLREPGRKNETQSRMWLIRGGPPRRPALIFTYRATRSADFLEEALANFSGTLMSDGFAGYDKITCSLRLNHAGCWDHARRKFVEAAKTHPESKSLNAVLRVIRGLYRVESFARKERLLPDEIYELRQRKSKRRLEYIKRWLDKMVVSIEPKSLMGSAVRYSLNQWPKLIAYLEDGRIPISNILVENAIRPFVIGRKNWMFSGGPRGAHASAILYSLIETAKANALEPYWYLRYLFERLPYVLCDDDFRALLPTRVTMTEIRDFFPVENIPA